MERKFNQELLTSVCYTVQGAKLRSSGWLWSTLGSQTIPCRSTTHSSFLGLDLELPYLWIRVVLVLKGKGRTKFLCRAWVHSGFSSPWPCPWLPRGFWGAGPAANGKGTDLCIYSKETEWGNFKSPSNTAFSISASDLHFPTISIFSSLFTVRSFRVIIHFHHHTAGIANPSFMPTLPCLLRFKTP